MVGNMGHRVLHNSQTVINHRPHGHSNTKDLKMTIQSREPTCIHCVLDAIQAVIQSADPATREALAATIDSYSEDFPEDFFWATGMQSPRMLYDLLMTIDGACRREVEPPKDKKPAAKLRVVGSGHSGCKE